MATHEEIKFLNSPKIGINKKKYCRFKKKRYQVHRLQGSSVLVEIHQRTGKIIATSYHREFIEIPA
jgi:hypothetical protein